MNYDPKFYVQNLEMIFKSELETKDNESYEWLLMLLGNKGNVLGLGHAEDTTKEQLEKIMYDFRKKNRKIKRINRIARTPSSEQFFIDCRETIDLIKKTKNKEL